MKWSNQPTNYQIACPIECIWYVFWRQRRHLLLVKPQYLSYLNSNVCCFSKSFRLLVRSLFLMVDDFKSHCFSFISFCLLFLLVCQVNPIFLELHVGYRFFVVVKSTYFQYLIYHVSFNSMMFLFKPPFSSKFSMVFHHFYWLNHHNLQGAAPQLFFGL